MPPARKPAPAAPSRPYPAGELALIERVRSGAAAGLSRRVKLGIGDDCAILTPPRGHDLLVTTDLSLEGRHFRRDWHPAACIGHRVLARGLSDLAAMGALPLAAFLSLALPRGLARDSLWLEALLDGLFALARHHRVPLAGGDTSESPPAPRGSFSPVLADITLLGSAPAGRALRRSGARPGDRLFVTGWLGGAATELASLAKPAKDPSSRPKRGGAERPLPVAGGAGHPHLFPQPRLAAGRALLRHRLATACIDLSDGLSTDLDHLCTASGVAAELDAAALPLHPLTHSLTPAAALHNALHGGEDYELLFSAAPAAKVPRSLGGVRLTCIGRVLKARKGQPTVTLLDLHHHRTPLHPGGWEHFT